MRVGLKRKVYLALTLFSLKNPVISNVSLYSNLKTESNFNMSWINIFCMFENFELICLFGHFLLTFNSQRWLFLRSFWLYQKGWNWCPSWTPLPKFNNSSSLSVKSHSSPNIFPLSYHGFALLQSISVLFHSFKENTH